jgi:hypothetical protein
MTYVANRRQYVIIAAGSNVLSFALPPKDGADRKWCVAEGADRDLQPPQFGLPVSNVGSGNIGAITSILRSNQ